MPDTLLHDAIVYDRDAQKILGIEKIDKSTSKKYISNRFNFYCSHCFTQDPQHFTRLKRVVYHKRFEGLGLYDRKDSTHRCDHPARYVDLTDENRLGEPLVTRYGAGPVKEDHCYSFPITITEQIDRAYQSVDKTRRLAKLVYALMYDQELRTRQRFEVGIEDLNIEELFVQNATDMTEAPRAIFFKPIARADIRLKNAYKGEIMGQGNTSLSCLDNVTYHAVKKMTERYGGNKSAPVLAFAKSVLVEDKEISKTPIRRFLIDSILQVEPWDHHINFDKAIHDQSSAPLPYDMPLFRCAI